MKEAAALTKDRHSDIVFDNMWGQYLLQGIPIDLFATGAYPDDKGLANGSVIAHYSNNKWTMFDTDGLKGIVEPLFFDNTDQSLYMRVTKYSNTYDSTFIYEYDQGKYVQLYKTILSKNWANIGLVDDKVYFILNTEIVVRTNNNFQTILNLDGTNFYRRIWGRNFKRHILGND